MTQIKTLLKWLYGIGFSITGLVIMVSISFIGGLLFLIAGLILFPPTLKIIEEKTGRQYKRPIKYGAVICLIFCGIFPIANTEVIKDDKKKKEDQAAFEKLPQRVKDSLGLVKAKQDSLDQIQKEIEQVAENAKGRKEKIEKLFSPWDGSHIELTRYIKKNMNDPDSYEHIETRFGDQGDYILVVTKFRGKNAFGGKVINTVTAKVDFDGNVLEIVSQD
ncbi:MAG TPA: hypothetical protein PK431_09995 [Chitinophagales bacterium]|nr:hypothetical protein [Chitinophagales bacterium]